MVIRCLGVISPASSTMNFMGRLQSNAPVSAAAKARSQSNLVPAPAFPSVFDMRHVAHRPLCTELHKIKPGMRDLQISSKVAVARSRTNSRAPKGPRTTDAWNLAC